MCPVTATRPSAPRHRRCQTGEQPHALSHAVSTTHSEQSNRHSQRQRPEVQTHTSSFVQPLLSLLNHTNSQHQHNISNQVLKALWTAGTQPPHCPVSNSDNPREHKRSLWVWTSQARHSTRDITQSQGAGLDFIVMYDQQRQTGDLTANRHAATGRVRMQGQSAQGTTI